MSEGLAADNGLRAPAQELLKKVLACAERACHENSAEATVDCVTSTAKELLGARSVATVLLDHESDALSIIGAQGLSRQFMRTYRRTVGTGVIGEILWNDRKVLVESADPSSAEYPDLKMELEFKSILCVRSATGGRPTGFLWADSSDPGAFKPEDLLTMRLLADLAALAVERERLQASSRAGSVATAARSAAASYGYFHRRLTEEIERAQRLNERMSLLLVAVDGPGEQTAARVFSGAGEEFFDEMSSRVKGMMRAIDVTGRYGAGQLVLYLPETSQDAAGKAAERIRAMVEHMAGKAPGSGPTVSIGTATLPENGETVEQLMNALTSALFKAQRAGGNRVSGPAEMYVL